MRDEDFNRYRPMFPQSKVWKVKTADQPARPVGPPQPTGQTGLTRGRARFLLQDSSIASRKRKRSRSLLLI